MNAIERWLGVERVQALTITALPRLASAVLILLTFWLLMRTTRPLLRGVLHRARFADALTDMLVEGVYKGSLVVIALIMSASQLGINVAAALAGLGVAGIALGFAAQETVANMIAGFLVFWDRPFKIGDYIATQNQYGRVQEITMRTTRIRTMENTYVIIPNKQIIGDMLVNHSLNGETRINIAIGIAYKESIAQARAVLLPVVNRVPGVLKSPSADVVVLSLGDSSVNLQVRAWIADSSQERLTQFAMLEACKTALDEAGIDIPFPHVQLIVDNISDQALRALSTLTRQAS